jgi:hypothetical protein
MSEKRPRKGIFRLAKRMGHIFRRRARAKLTVAPGSATGIALSEQTLRGDVVESIRDESEPVFPPAPLAAEPAQGPTKVDEEITGQPVVVVAPIAKLRDVEANEGGDHPSSPDVQRIPPEGEEPVQADDEVISSDSLRTLERYKTAIERIIKALELRRNDWEQFELSGFDSLPFGDGQDLANLQIQIDKVLDSRIKASKNRRKSNDLLESCFRALAPFTKNVLAVAQQAGQVTPPLGLESNM